MARGPSGRIVVDIDPALKRDLHAALAAEGISLKDWLIERANRFIAERNQPFLLAAEEPPPYRTAPPKPKS
jgi:hypothetical protein